MGELQLLAQPNKWCLLQVTTSPKYWCPNTTDSLKNVYYLTQKISYLSFCRLWNSILSLAHLGQGYFTEETTTNMLTEEMTGQERQASQTALTMS